MKKTLKKTGIAILTMAMLLSMGAMTAITASAAGESITVSESTGLKAGDTVCVYKVATKTDAGWEWETPYKKVTGISWAQIGTFGDYSDKAMKLAVMLANVENDTFVKGVVGTPISVSGAGYYLVKADEIRTAKVVKLWLQIFFYSLPVFLVLVLFTSPDKYAMMEYREPVYRSGLRESQRIRIILFPWLSGYL